MSPEERARYNEYHREYHRRPEVKEKQAQRERERAKDPEIRAVKAARMREWRSANPERQAASVRRYAVKHAEARKAYMREWRKQNAEALAAYAKAHPPENPEAARARARQWRLDHPEQARLNSAAGVATHRARLRGVIIGKVDRAAVIARGKGVCGICHQPVSPANLSLDHIVPISRGGPHTEANLQVAHMSCNRRKFNRIT